MVYNVTEIEDNFLSSLSVDELAGEIVKLRTAIRQDRDATGHDLCWYRPELWKLLPEGLIRPSPLVPSTQEFLHHCALYRKSLDADPVIPCEPKPPDKR